MRLGRWKIWLLLNVTILAVVAVGVYAVVWQSHRAPVPNSTPAASFMFCHFVKCYYRGANAKPMSTENIYYSRQRDELRIETIADTGEYPMSRPEVKLCSRTRETRWNVGDSVGISQARPLRELDPIRELQEMLMRVRHDGDFLGQQMENGIAVEVYHLQYVRSVTFPPDEITVAFNQQGLPHRIERTYPLAMVGSSSNLTPYRMVWYHIEYDGDDDDTLFMPPAGMIIESR